MRWDEEVYAHRLFRVYGVQPERFDDDDLDTCLTCARDGYCQEQMTCSANDIAFEFHGDLTTLQALEWMFDADDYDPSIGMAADAIVDLIGRRLFAGVHERTMAELERLEIYYARPA